MASTGPCHSRAAKTLLNTQDIKFVEEFMTARPCVQHTHRARCVPHVQESATSRPTDCILGLPDLPYFTGDPVFQLGSPASREEAARETESPVFFDYRLIQIGRIYKFCDSNLHYAAWCDEYKSFMQRTLWERHQQ